MKSLKKIAPIILIVIMALSWYNVLNGSVTNANAYKGYVSSAKKNLEENCIPECFKTMDYTGYQEFLKQRRMLMAAYIKKYYFGLS